MVGNWESLVVSKLGPSARPSVLIPEGESREIEKKSLHLSAIVQVASPSNSWESYHPNPTLRKGVSFTIRRKRHELEF